MNKFKILFKKYYYNEKIQKIAISTFIAFVIFSVVFLSFSLLKYYKNNIVDQKDVKLFYTFKPHTLKKYSNSLIADADISEKFLSYNVSYGIDVSEWQGDIDWETVASTGISFAIIRCGFRETQGARIKEDAYFRKNIVEARNAGLNVGVYFFGTARTADEAREEAEFTLDLIKDYDINYPIVYDFEVFNRDRLTGIDYSTSTDNILIFTDIIESYGYASMIYSYKSAFSSYLDTGRLDGKLLWLAHFVEQTDYTGNYNMWQYSETGSVAGITGNVDLNVSYFTYVDSEKDIVQNPNYVSAPDMSFTSVDEEVKTLSNAVLRNSPTTYLPNKLRTLPYGTTLQRVGISDEYSKVLYNGRVAYIKNSDLI